MPRPELGPIAIGDPVFVTLYERDRGRYTTVPATVTTDAGHHLVLTETDPYPALPAPREWLVSRSAQTTDHPNPYDRAEFATPAQRAWDEATHAATAYLRQQGIDVAPGSRWASDDGRQELATLIRQHTTTEN